MGGVAGSGGETPSAAKAPVTGKSPGNRISRNGPGIVDARVEKPGLNNSAQSRTVGRQQSREIQERKQSEENSHKDVSKDAIPGSRGRRKVGVVASATPIDLPHGAENKDKLEETAKAKTTKNLLVAHGTVKERMQKFERGANSETGPSAKFRHTKSEGCFKARTNLAGTSAVSPSATGKKISPIEPVEKKAKILKKSRSAGPRNFALSPRPSKSEEDGTKEEESATNRPKNSVGRVPKEFAGAKKSSIPEKTGSLPSKGTTLATKRVKALKLAVHFSLF